MADNGNQDGGGRNGGDGGQKQRPQPTDIRTAKLERENRELRTILHQLTQGQGMNEGPMGSQMGIGSRHGFEEPDLGELGRGDRNDLDDLTMDPNVLPPIPPMGVCPIVRDDSDALGLHQSTSAQNAADVAPPQETRPPGKLRSLEDEIAASPVKAVLSRILDWRFLGLAVVPIVAHATYKLFAFPKRLSFDGIFDQYLSSAKSFGYAVAHPIKAATELEFAFGGKFWETMGKAWDFINPVSKFSGMEFPTWSAAGTIGSVVVGAVFTVSAILNRQSISRMCRRVAGAITALSLPSIASEISNNLQTRAQTVSNALDLTPGGVGALYIASLLFVASYVVTQSNPVSEWIKRKKEGHSGGNPAACQSQGDVPRNAPGQAVPLDANGGSKGTESWVAQPAAQPAPSQPKERSKIGAAAAGVVGAVAGALMYLPNKAAEAWRSRFGGRRTQRRNGPAFANQAGTVPMPQAGRSQAENNTLTVVRDWANDEPAPQGVVDELANFMETASMYPPGIWMPVFNALIAAEPRDGTGEYEQFRNIVDQNGAIGAMVRIVEANTEQVDEVLRGESARGVGDVDTSFLREVHEAIGKYSGRYERMYREIVLAQSLDGLETAILEVERRQGANN